MSTPVFTPKGYTDIEAIESYLLIDIAQYFEPKVNEWIAEVEKYIDRVTNRSSFIADSVATERYYDGDNTRELFIDDAVEVTEISIGTDENATVFEPTDERDEYLLYPANALVDKKPYNSIKLTSGIFERGDQNIKVTAKWGYSVEVPADVKLVATILVSDIIEESMSAEGEVQSMSIGRYSVTYKTEERWGSIPQVKELIETYRSYKNF